MAIPKVLWSVAKKAGNYYGLYTKKQCVDISINIGKELVDLSKANGGLTDDIIATTVKKHVPNVNVQIYNSEKALQKELIRIGESEEFVNSISSGRAALYFNMQGKAKGIYIPKIETDKEISNFVHEFEHYLYNEHTPKRKSVLTFVQSAYKVNKKIKSLFKTSVKEAPKRNVKVKDPLLAQKDLQGDIVELFGIQHLEATGKLKGVGPNSDDIVKLLEGENFTGLTSPARRKAYIRAITRAQSHPKMKNQWAQLQLMKTTIDDEVRAYKVSDEVLRYASGSSDVTWQGLMSDILSQTSKVLDDEIELAWDVMKKGSGKANIKTGLPTTSFVGERFKDPLTALLQSSFDNATVYGEPILLSKLKDPNRKRIPVKVTELPPVKIKKADCGIFAKKKSK